MAMPQVVEREGDVAVALPQVLERRTYKIRKIWFK